MILPGVRKRTDPAIIKSPRRGFSQNPYGIFNRRDARFGRLSRAGRAALHITPSGFQNEFLRDFAIAEPCTAWLHFINPERVKRE